MAKGPAISNYDERLIKFQHAPRDTSFRLIKYYEIRTDENMLRIDIKYGPNQYNACVPCAEPTKPLSGSPIRPTDDLLTPSSGVLDCLNIKAPRAAIIEALAELLEDLKKDDAS